MRTQQGTSARAMRRAAERGKTPRLTADQKKYQARKTQKIQSLLGVAARLERSEQEAQAALDVQNDLPFSHPTNLPRIAMVFDPIDALLLQVEQTGEMDAMQDGTPLMFINDENGDESFYPVVTTFECLVETYQKIARVYGWQDGTEGMVRLTKKLRYVSPISQRDIDHARETIAWMKEHTLLITPHQFSAEMRELEISRELKLRQVARKAS